MGMIVCWCMRFTENFNPLVNLLEWLLLRIINVSMHKIIMIFSITEPFSWETVSFCLQILLVNREKLFLRVWMNYHTLHSYSIRSFNFLNTFGFYLLKFFDTGSMFNTLVRNNFDASMNHSKLEWFRLGI